MSASRPQSHASGKAGPNAGFVYAAYSDGGPLIDAAPGDVIGGESPEAPWIVVDHAIESVQVNRWPGRLWKAQILRPATTQPGDGASYTRAVAVALESEVPAGRLFGPHGDKVVSIVDRASSLELDDVHALAARNNEQANAAYLKAWNAWLENPRPIADHADADDGATVSAFAKARSPVGAAFTVIHSALSARAQALLGDAALVVDEEDGVWVLNDLWSQALGALLNAAMAVGAPHLCSTSDRLVLCEAWHGAFAGR